MYRIPSTALAVVIYLVLPTVNADDDTKEKAKKEVVAKELKVLEGTWEVLSATVEGRESRFPKGRRPRLEVMEDRKAPPSSGSGAAEVSGTPLQRGIFFLTEIGYQPPNERNQPAPCDAQVTFFRHLLASPSS
jgi:hypothetical protein